MFLKTMCNIHEWLSFYLKLLSIGCFETFFNRLLIINTVECKTREIMSFKHFIYCFKKKQLTLIWLKHIAFYQSRTTSSYHKQLKLTMLNQYKKAKQIPTVQLKWILHTCSKQHFVFRFEVQLLEYVYWFSLCFLNAI